mmetsp:Transcript_72931/g.131392  ORF Transcript_72931/g.131392 Transcript_72931/m.131392 type:complete len:201 (+) Transcript_72931:3680-4282(+)
MRHDLAKALCDATHAGLGAGVPLRPLAHHAILDGTLRSGQVGASPALRERQRAASAASSSLRVTPAPGLISRPTGAGAVAPLRPGSRPAGLEGQTARLQATGRRLLQAARASSAAQRRLPLDPPFPHRLTSATRAVAQLPLSPVAHSAAHDGRHLCRRLLAPRSLCSWRNAGVAEACCMLKHWAGPLFLSSLDAGSPVLP